MSVTTGLAEYAAVIEPALDRLMPACDGAAAGLFEAARYSLLAGGKRLRGALLLEFFTLCGGRPLEAALPFACALEMIHAYSLIHDDLPCMDDDAMRRGRPSCHIAFGEATALLAGDALLNRAFEVMAGAEGIVAERALAALGYIGGRSGAFGMAGGQMIDLSLAGQARPKPELHREMAALKTGALFRAACVGGCLLAGGDAAALAGAERFAQGFGLAFQLTDDLLDESGDPASLGKPVGSDRAGGKHTFATLYGPARCREMAENMLGQAREGLGRFPQSAFLENLCRDLISRDR